MKHVILSADGPRSVWAVPDVVADNLDAYCMKFCTDWLKNAPEAEKYRVMRGGSVVYFFNEKAFIEYLDLLFPDEKPVFVRELGFLYDREELPDEYKRCPDYNF